MSQSEANRAATRRATQQYINTNHVEDPTLAALKREGERQRAEADSHPAGWMVRRMAGGRWPHVWEVCRWTAAGVTPVASGMEESTARLLWGAGK